MSKRTIYLALLLGAILVAPRLHASEVIDRIVATVNGHIILQSDVDEALAYQALADGGPLTQVSAERRKATLDRLIDQELIREEVPSSDYPPAAAAEIDARIAEIRKLHHEVTDDAAWLAVLQHYGLSLDELRQRVNAELNSWRAVYARLRPSVAVDSRSIERYYQENLLPQLRQKGAPEVPLAQVAPQIKEILAQQQINNMLAAWLNTLRAESKIQIAFIPGIASGGGSH